MTRSVTVRLARRHVTLFFRDPAAVFFSLLSALIVFVIYAVFLDGVQVDGLQQAVPDASEADVQAFVHTWMFASVVMIASMTTSLSALSVFVDDRISQRFQDFLVSPVSRYQLVVSYLAAAAAVSLVMTTVVLALSQVYLLVADGAALAADHLAAAFGLVVVFCLMFSALWSFTVSFIRSDSVFMSVGTIVGTAGGFLCGAFINVGSLPSGVVSVMNVLPLNPAASLMRRVFTSDTLTGLTDDPTARAGVGQQYGTVLELAGQTTTAGTVLSACAALFLASLLLGARRLGQRIR